MDKRPSLIHPMVSLFCWALYDWANSAFAAIIQTFVFAAYFAQHIANDPIQGGKQWGLVNGIAALTVALSAPLFGAIADKGGFRKRWLAFFTFLCLIATGLLWFVYPSSNYLLLAMILVGIGIYSSELAFVFYNAMLPDLTTPDSLGKWSGWGWGFGYVGGTLSLILALVLFVQPEGKWLALDTSTAEHVRATFLLAAIWYLIFSLPAFLVIPETTKGKRTMTRAIAKGFKELRTTLANLASYRDILLFLIARMFYIDGLTTLFAFGGIYAATTFSMDAQELLLFGIALNISSGIGAASFAWLDDAIGSRNLILLSLTGLAVPSTTMLLTSNLTLFWMFGLLLGLFVGPVQSASRAFMARLAPEHLRHEMFGFYAFSGKATAFLGPLLISWIISLTASQRVGMSVIVVFFIIGFTLMLWIPSRPGS